MPKTINERLAGLTIKDPETGEDVTVSLGLLQRYLLQPNLLNAVLSKARAAAADTIEDPGELAATLRALDEISEELWNTEAQNRRNSERFQGVRDLALSFERKLFNKFRAANLRIGMFDIGDEHIPQEPQVFEIEDQYDISRIGSLRSDTDAVVVGQNTHSEIRVHLTFSSLEQINNLLRPLLAQCRAAPIVTLESDIVIDTMFNQFASPDELNRMLDLVAATDDPEFAPLEQLSQEATESLDKLTDLIASGDSALFYSVARRRQEFYKKVKDQQNVPEQVESQSKPFYGVALPVALREVQITTDPDAAHVLNVVMVFRRINEKAFSTGRLRFRGPDGSPTFDIKKCEPLRAYFTKTYLEDAGRDGQILMQPIPREDTQVKCPLRLEWLAYHNQAIRELDFRDADVTIHKLSIGYRNKLAFLPIQGQHSPAVQYMGVSNSMVQLQLITKDRNIIRKVHALKDEMDETRRRYGALDRDMRFTVENGVINLVGAREFVMSALTTQNDPRSKELWYINITMVESKYSLREREQTTLFQDYYHPDHTKALWDYMFYVGRRAIVNLELRNPLSATEEQVLGALFGSGMLGFDERIHEVQIAPIDSLAARVGLSGPPGIINTRTFAAALTYFFRSSNSSADVSWLHPQDRSGLNFVEGILTDENAKDAELAAEFSSPIFTTPEASFQGRLRPIRRLMEHIIETTSSNNVQARSDLILDVMISTNENFFEGFNWFSKKFWDALYFATETRAPDSNPNRNGVKWTAEDMAQAHSLLIGLLATGVADRWEGFDQSRFVRKKKFRKLASSDGDLDPSDNYPDMYLPRYSDLFDTELTPENDPAVLEVVDGIPVLDPKVGLSRGRRRPVWTNFAPRWRDLGRTPPFEVRAAFNSMDDALNQIARNYNDRVEPGFFYYRESWKDRLTVKGLNEEAQRRLSEAKNYVIQLDHSIVADGTLPQRTLDNLITHLLRDGKLDKRSATARLALDRAGGSGAPAAKELLRKINQVDAEVPVINFIDREGMLIAYAVHAPGSSWDGNPRHFKVMQFKGAPLQIRNPYNDSVIDKDEAAKPAGIISTLSHMPDDHFSFQRAYPTYRVYAIEEDREQLIYSDDFYGINCVSSIEIHHSKKAPSLAILKITNTSGQFENETFLDYESERLRQINPDDENEPFFRNFRFKTGTLIQIRMGYSSRPEELPISFSGRVVEVQTGPVITLICQDHRVDMLQEIEYLRSTCNIFQILDDCFKKIDYPSGLGRSAKMGEIAVKLANDLLGERAGSEINRWGKWWNHKVNSHLRNVFVESNSPRQMAWFDVFSEGFSEEYSRATDQKVQRFLNNIPVVEWFLDDGKFDAWVVPLRPMWDMVEELVRHRPGTIAYVTPFEQDGTLFIGTPTTPYQFENPTIGEKRDYDRLHHIARSIAQTDLRDVALAGFLESPFYGNFDFQAAFDERFNTHSSFLQLEVRTVADLDRATLNSYRNAQRINAANLGGPNFVDVTKFEPQIAFDHSLYLDFSSDWKYLMERDTQLARAVFAFYWGLPFDAPWGALEGEWTNLATMTMGPLYSMSDQGRVGTSPTAVFEDLFSQYLNNPNSALHGHKVASGSLGGGFQEATREYGNQQLQKWLYQIERDGSDFQTMVETLDQLEQSGRVDEEILARLRQQIYDKRELYREFEVPSDEERYRRGARIKEQLGFDVKDSLGGVPDRRGFPAAYAAGAGHFRLFVHYFTSYLKAELDRNTLLGRELRKNETSAMFKDARMTLLPPGWKIFRDVHMVTSENDIIENNVSASFESMHNTVTVRHPDEEWKLVHQDPPDEDSNEPTAAQLEAQPVIFKEGQKWVSYPSGGGIPFRPGIGKEYRKLLVQVEQNANNPEKAARCLYSNMKLAMQPMYRGSLLLVGRNMKPYDVVHIKDDFTDMLGPIEVDEVIHHFNPEMGWTTQVVPHALIHVDDIVSRVSYNWLLDILGDVSEWYEDNWLWVELGLFAMAAFTGGGSLGVGALIRGAAAGAGRVGARSAARIVATRTVRRTLLKAGVKRATLHSVAKKSGARAAKAGAEVLRKNPNALFGAIGRALGRTVRTAQGVSPFLAVGSVALNTYMSTSYIKAKMGDTELPIDLQPLILKGRPYTAGLEYGYDEVWSSSEKVRGLFHEIFGESNRVADALPSLLSASVNDEAQQGD